MSKRSAMSTKSIAQRSTTSVTLEKSLVLRKPNVKGGPDDSEEYVRVAEMSLVPVGDTAEGRGSDADPCTRTPLTRPIAKQDRSQDKLAAYASAMLAVRLAWVVRSMFCTGEHSSKHGMVREQHCAVPQIPSTCISTAICRARRHCPWRRAIKQCFSDSAHEWMRNRVPVWSPQSCWACSTCPHRRTGGTKGEGNRTKLSNTTRAFVGLPPVATLWSHPRSDDGIVECFLQGTFRAKPAFLGVFKKKANIPKSVQNDNPAAEFVPIRIDPAAGKAYTFNSRRNREEAVPTSFNHWKEISQTVAKTLARWRQEGREVDVAVTSPFMRK